MENLSMEVVDLRIVYSHTALKALADVKFGGCLIVRGFSVLKGKQGIFVSLPKKAQKDGRWYDVAIFTNGEAQKQVEDLIMTAYEKELEVAS